MHPLSLVRGNHGVLVTTRVVATSDLHLTPETAPYVWAALDEFRAAAEHADASVIAGDVLDQPETLHTRTFLELRRRLQEWPTPIYVLAGNHDQHDAPRAALEALEGGRVEVVTSHRWNHLSAMVPYVRTEEEWRAAIAALGLARTASGGVLFAHQGFRGAYLNAMRRDATGMPCDSVPPGWVVATGHYHCPQNLGPVVYCGSPYETTFAEEGQAKGFLVWDDIHGNPVPRRVAYGDLGAPKHHTVWWDPDQGPPTRPDVRPGDRVRVRTLAGRRRATEAATQLVTVGLEAVPVLAEADEATARGVVASTLGPREAAEAYAARVIGARGVVSPADMDELAEEAGLWHAG